VTGYPEGAQVTFDIYDASTDPPCRIDSVYGKNDQGTAKAEWIVADPQCKGEELKLEFEGMARSKASERSKIEVRMVVDFFFSM
jgi:hypothetical protein